MQLFLIPGTAFIGGSRAVTIMLKYTIKECYFGQSTTYLVDSYIQNVDSSISFEVGPEETLTVPYPYYIIKEN